jgi:hypothetical protein
MLQQYRCLLVSLVLAMSLPLPACASALPPTYSAEAIEAWVVDEETGQPLEGVIVAAHWQLYGGYHRAQVGQMMVMETVTDSKGRFFFPAWGPKPRPSDGYLDTKDPELLLFKNGYEYVAAPNRLTEKVNKSAQRRSDWNGKTIKMKKFEGGLEEYARHLRFLNTSLESITQGKDCDWRQVPRMLLALDQQEKLFKGKGFYYNLPNIESLPDQDKCGSAREFFRSYLP